MDPFGNPSASVNIEKVPPPYDNAHELKTDAPPTGCTTQQDCTPQAAHRSSAVDAATPLDGGAPHFLAAWRYLVGP